MSFEARVIKTLIASPSDVISERKAIPEVLHAWNAANAETRRGVAPARDVGNTRSPPVDGSSAPGDHQQAVRQELGDVLIGVFWTRIGTHTGVAESGTVEGSRSSFALASLSCCTFRVRRSHLTASTRPSTSTSWNSNGVRAGGVRRDLSIRSRAQREAASAADGRARQSLRDRCVGWEGRIWKHSCHPHPAPGGPRASCGRVDGGEGGGA